MAQLGCAVAQLGCGVAQLVVHWLAVWQAQVRFSDWHPIEASLADRRSDEDTKIQASANGEG
jgi:hypothetical protein